MARGRGSKGGIRRPTAGRKRAIGPRKCKCSLDPTKGKKCRCTWKRPKENW